MAKLRPLEHTLNTRLGEVTYSKKLSSILVDIPLILSLIVTLVFGLFILYSASGQSDLMITRQGIYIIFGIIFMIAIAQLQIKTYQAMATHLIWVAISLLVIVLIIPAEGYKTNRWIDLGFISFQPSEIVRLILPLSIASFLTRKRTRLLLKDWLIVILAIFVCSFLVIKQPDLGTSIIIITAGFLPVFLAGFPLFYLFSFSLIFFLMSPFLWGALKEYQKQRIITLFNPDADPLGAGWNISQSKTAIGSGGISGKGYLEGTQSQLDFIPESHSDFIFAVLGEEFGFIGILFLIILYAFIFYRSLKIALNSKSEFGRVLVGSLTFIFIIYVFINILMVVGIIPVVGVPLPLISQGGTSMLIHLLSFGFILSIKRSNHEIN
jgi:rod shape determining protein RodA